MSKLIANRTAAKGKKSTLLLSVQTAKDAVQIGKSLLNAYMAEDINGPQVDKLAEAVDHLEALLYSQPDQMQQEGATNVEDYFDDAILPDVARQAKAEVDMISQLRREQRPAQVTKQPAQQPVAQPAMASSEKAAGNDAFVTDRDESGSPKAPEKLEVPRIAAKKKEAQPEAAPAPPAAAPAAPAAGGGSLDALFAKLPSDFVADLVKKLTSLEGFEQDKDVQAAVENLAGILQTRPVEAAPAPGAPAAAPTASAKKGGDFGGKQAPPFGKKDEAKKEDKKDDKKASSNPIFGLNLVAAEKVAVAPPGREDQVKALKKEDVDNPYAVAWSSYNKGHKGSALKQAAAAVAAEMAKAAAGGFTWDQDTGDVVESAGRTPEVAEAHSKVDEAPAHLDRPTTTSPIKLAADMSAAKAVKEAERLGNELKKTYLDAKAICTVNDSRPVREFVESIFRAGDMADEAVKTLNKQVMQEESEEEAAKIKKDKKSSFRGLAFVASAE